MVKITGHDANAAVAKAPHRSELMKAIDALRAFVPHAGSEIAAMEQLASKLRNGEIKAYALRTWELDKPNGALIWKKVPEGARKNQMISRGKLVQSRSWKEDCTNWRWKSGNFFVRSRNTCTMYKGVRFVPKDVNEAAKRMEKLQREIKKRSGGAPNKHGARDDVWLAIAELLVSRGKEAFANRDRAVGDILKTVKWTTPRAGGEPGEIETLSPGKMGEIATLVRKRLGLARGEPGSSGE